MRKHANIKTFRLLLMLLLVLSAIIFPTMILPESLAYASASLEEIQYVYDKAGLLSTSEIEELEEMCTEYGEEAGIEIILLTHEDSSAPYAERYIEEFEMQFPVGDRVYALIDMNERIIFMAGYGLAETYIHSKRIDVILDEMYPYVADGEYYDAFAISIKRSAEYMSDDSELNYDHDYSANTPQTNDPGGAYYDETWPTEYNTYEDSTARFLKNPFVQLIAAIIIGAISVAIMAYNSGGKMTAGSSTYMDPNHSGLIGRRDNYIRTSVTKVRRPETNNTGGRSGGGFNSGGFRGGSFGGRSHSSGGRKF